MADALRLQVEIEALTQDCLLSHVDKSLEDEIKKQGGTPLIFLRRFMDTTTDKDTLIRAQYFNEQLEVEGIGIGSETSKTEALLSSSLQGRIHLPPSLANHMKVESGQVLYAKIMSPDSVKITQVILRALNEESFIDAEHGKWGGKITFNHSLYTTAVIECYLLLFFFLKPFRL